MRPLPPELASVTTDVELYDVLQQMFGLGNFDEAVSTEPWYKSRMVEIMKIRGLCRRRRTSVRQVAIAAWYAREHGIAVKHSVTLFALIPKAMVEFRDMERRAADEEEKALLDDAINHALDHGYDQWAQRLLRAAPGNVRSLLNDFQKELQ